MTQNQQPNSNVAVLKPHEEAPPKLPSMQTGGGRVLAIIPTTLDEAWRLANVAFKGGICPKDCDSPENAMTRVLHGMEVGLPPMAAIQSIAVINGRPTIWGDAAIALIRASGKCKYIREFEEERSGGLTAVCVTHRVGEDEPIERTWSVADEKVAGLFGKDIHGKYPARMRQMRARAFCLRDAYADVLKGLGFAEEVQDYGDDPIGRGRARTEVQQTINHRPAEENPDPFAPVPAQAAAVAEAEKQQQDPEVVAKIVETTGAQIPIDGDVISPTTGMATASKPEIVATDALPPMPDPAQELAAFCNWVDLCLKEFQDGSGESANEWWEETVDPAIKDLFPMDQETVQGVWSRHENRLVP